MKSVVEELVTPIFCLKNNSYAEMDFASLKLKIYQSVLRISRLYFYHKTILIDKPNSEILKQCNS